MKKINENDKINELKKLWIYDPELYPVKIYCWNFSRRKLWIMWCSEEVLKFIIKYIPENIIWNMWINRDKIVYVNFKNCGRLTWNFGAWKNLPIKN